MRGGGQEGIGEDVTYDAVDHVAQQDAGPPAGLAGSRSFAEFSDLLGETDLFPAAAPERDVSREYRRWAFESAALDLALRQAGTNLADALGREPRPVNFVSSMRLAGFGSDERSSIDPLLARLAVYPTLRFKLDPTNDWDDELIAALVADRSGRLARPQGLLQRHAGRRRDRPGALREADRGLPRRLAGGPRRQRGDPAAARPGRRAGHLGRADPLDRRHRGDALGAEDGQHQALALRPDPQPLRHL